MNIKKKIKDKKGRVRNSHFIYFTEIIIFFYRNSLSPKSDRISGRVSKFVEEGGEGAGG